MARKSNAGFRRHLNVKGAKAVGRIASGKVKKGISKIGASARSFASKHPVATKRGIMASKGAGIAGSGYLGYKIGSKLSKKHPKVAGAIGAGVGAGATAAYYHPKSRAFINAGVAKGIAKGSAMKAKYSPKIAAGIQKVKGFIKRAPKV